MNNSNPQLTGRQEGHWKEYSEIPPGHSTGYFWLRSDGLRFGLRVAGTYYRPGTSPEPLERPFHPLQYPSWHPKYELIDKVPMGSYFDGAMAMDLVGQLREEDKQEQLPAHLRVMRNGQEIELISKIDGIDLEIMLKREDFDPFVFIDKRFPINRTVDAASC